MDDSEPKIVFNGLLESYKKYIPVLNGNNAQKIVGYLQKFTGEVQKGC